MTEAIAVAALLLAGAAWLRLGELTEALIEAAADRDAMAKRIAQLELRDQRCRACADTRRVPRGEP